MDHLIHMVPINILFDNTSFLDKTTVSGGQLIAYERERKIRPTTSQPDTKTIENLLGYLATYYDSAVVVSVSRALSGTHNAFIKAVERMGNESFPVTVIDSLQNSGAQGLLVMEGAEMIARGYGHDEVVERLEEAKKQSKILVSVPTLDSMIRSGRLSKKSGKIAKILGLQPLVTLDEEGDGALQGIAFSTRGSWNQIKKHMTRIQKSKTIKAYCVVHTNSPEQGQALAEEMTALLNMEPTYICETSAVVAVGAGEGAVAVAYVLA